MHKLQKNTKNRGQLASKVLAALLALPAVMMAETKTLQLADCIDANGNLSYKAATNGEVAQFGDGGPIMFGESPFTGNTATFTPANLGNTLTILNPLKLHNNDRVNVSYGFVKTGGASLQDGVTSGDIYKLGAGVLVFNADGPLSLPGLITFHPSGGTVMFDGGTHAVNHILQSANTTVFTNGATVAIGAMNLGRDNANNHAKLYSYDSTVTASGGFNLGHHGSSSGTYTLTGGSLNLTSTSGANSIGSDNGKGTLNVKNGTVNFALAPTVGNSSGGATGTLRIFSGGIVNAGTSAGMLSFGHFGGGTAGNLYMEGDSALNIGNNVVYGREGVSRVTVAGGTITQTRSEFSMGRFDRGTTRTGTGDGRIDMSGGEYRYWPENNSMKAIGWGGTGVVSVASSAVFSMSNTVTLAADATGYGEIDLYEGGVFEAKKIDFGNGRQKIATDGGTFRVLGNAATVDYFGNASRLDESYVGRRGVTFDTGNNTATVGSFALDGKSPGAIRKTGSGTLVLSGLPQTHKGVEVNEGTLRLASGATVGAAYSPAAAAQKGNVYPDDPSDGLVEANYLLHRWSFTGGNLADSIAGSVATVCGGGHADGVLREGGMVALPGGTTHERYLDLGSGLFGEEDGPFTIEMWVRIDEFTGAKLFTLGSTKSGVSVMFINATGLVCARENGSPGGQSMWGGDKGYPCAVGEVLHLSVVMGAPDANGKRAVTFRAINTSTGETTHSLLFSSTSPYSPVKYQDFFRFGWSWVNEVDSKLAVDEVRIWRAALSQAQLEANAALGPDEVPLLGFVSGSGPAKVASGATFDLGGNTIAYPGIAGAGTVRNGTATVAALAPEGSTMRLEADVTVTGSLLFGDGDSFVATGTLDVDGAEIRYTGTVGNGGAVLVSAEGNGEIVGVPASVDLGTNKGYKLSVRSGSIRIVKKGLVLIVK